MATLGHAFAGATDLPEVDNRKEREAQWWRAWREADFSWDGLAAKEIAGGGAQGQKTLQDYWRRDIRTGRVRDDWTMEADGELVTFDGRLWHLVHLPLRSADGQIASWKEDPASEEWATLVQLVRHRLWSDSGASSSERDTRTQLRGAVLLSLPTAEPASHEDPHIHCERAVFLEDVVLPEKAFAPDAVFERALFLGNVDFSQARFQRGANFSRAQFHQDAAFEGARFVGTTTFWRANFFEKGGFAGVAFSGEVDFGKADFLGETSFEDAQFEGGASFANAEFSTGVSFENVGFGGYASFGGARFDSVTFDRAIFAQLCGLTRISVAGRATFNSATFRGEADFSGARLTYETIFEAAAFNMNATFEGAILHEAVFTGATFEGRAVFRSVAFERKADFSGIEFSDLGDFGGARFGGEASFQATSFKGGAVFAKANFHRDADFREAAFAGDARFDDAEFRRADFTEAGFAKLAVFGATRFMGEARFDGARFQRAAHFSGWFEEGGSFHNAVFERQMIFSAGIFLPELNFSRAFYGARFADIADFSNAGPRSPAAGAGRVGVRLACAFADALFEKTLILTDGSDAVSNAGMVRSLAKVEEAAEADLEAARERWRADGEEGMYDDLANLEKARNIRLAELEAGCRTVKIAMGKARDEIREQRYYRFQLRARQARTDVAWTEKSIGRLYGFASDFGGSLRRPLLLWLLMAMVAGIAYWHAAVWLGQSTVIASNGAAHTRQALLDANDLGSAMSFSFARSAVVGAWMAPPPDPTGWHAGFIDGHGPIWAFTIRALAAVQTILSGILIFLFALAVRRRFQLS